MVAEVGVEPTHPCEYTILSRARLPVPPLGHIGLASNKNYLTKLNYTIKITERLIDEPF